jgi:hypothetical protein
MRSAVAALLVFFAAAARAEDTSPPVIVHTPVTSTARGAKFVQVFATITDESKFFPQVFFRYGPGDYQKPVDMKPVKGVQDQYGANVPIKGDVVEYYLEAYDELGNGPARSGDPARPYHVDTSGMPPAVARQNVPAPQPAKSPWATAAPAPAPAPAPAVQAPAPRPVVVQRSGRVWTWVVGGIGLGTLAGGLIAGNEFKTQDDAYQQNLAAPGSNYAALNAEYTANKSLGQKATILMIAGGALLATSVVLYFVEGGGDQGGSGGDAALHF